MDARRGKGWIRIALVVALAGGMPPIVLAQGRGAGDAQAPAGAQGRAGGPPGRGGAANPNAGAPYTPAPNARDLRAVVFHWMWGMGMLKGTDERDMVATLEYQSKGGTIQVDGQPCTLSRYRASTNYQTFSQRIQYTCTRASTQATSNIEVVSWQHALQPIHQPDGGLRALLTVPLRSARPPALQASALGKGAAARHVDEQGGPGDDVPAARGPAPGSAA